MSIFACDLMQRRLVEDTFTAAYREQLENAVKAAQSIIGAAGQDLTQAQGYGLLPSRLPDSARGFLRPLPEAATSFSKTEQALLYKDPGIFKHPGKYRHPGKAATAAAKQGAATAASLALAAAGRGPYAIALAEAMSAAGKDVRNPKTSSWAVPLKDAAAEALWAAIVGGQAGTRQGGATAGRERKFSGVRDQEEGADLGVAGAVAVKPGVGQQGGLVKGGMCCSSHGLSAAAAGTGKSSAAAAASRSSSNSECGSSSAVSTVASAGPTAAAAAVSKLSRGSGQGRTQPKVDTMARPRLNPAAAPRIKRATEARDGTTAPLPMDSFASAPPTGKTLAVAATAAAAAADDAAALLIAEEEAAAAKAASKQGKKPVRKKAAKQVRPGVKDLGARAAASGATQRPAAAVAPQRPAAAVAHQRPAAVPLPIGAAGAAVPDAAQTGLSSMPPYMQTPYSYHPADEKTPNPMGLQAVRMEQNSTLAGSADQQDHRGAEATSTAAGSASFHPAAGGCAAAAGAGGAPLLSSVQCPRKLKKKAKQEGSLSACIVCWEASPCGVLLPCKHLALCEGCSELLKRKGSDCPMCRGPVTEHMVVFHV